MSDALAGSSPGSVALNLTFSPRRATGRLTLPGNPAQVVALRLERTNPLPMDEGYESLTGQQKLDALWAIVQQQPYARGAYPKLGSQEALNDERGLLSKDVRARKRADLKAAIEMPGFDLSTLLTFFNKSDVHPPRWRLRHPFGSVAKVRLESLPGNPYTGLFLGGNGLLRLSLNVDAKTKHNPGIGLKLMVDGQRSANILASTVFDPTQDARGFFAHTMVNENDQGYQKLDHVAEVTPAGVKVAKRRLKLFRRGERTRGASAPKRLFFVPAAGLPASTASGDFRDLLATIQPRTVLYTLRDGEGRSFAVLKTTSAFVASEGGDRLLHTSHLGFRPWGIRARIKRKRAAAQKVELPLGE